MKCSRPSSIGRCGIPKSGDGTQHTQGIQVPGADANSCHGSSKLKSDEHTYPDGETPTRGPDRAHARVDRRRDRGQRGLDPRRCVAGARGDRAPRSLAASASRSSSGTTISASARCAPTPAPASASSCRRPLRSAEAIRTAAVYAGTPRVEGLGTGPDDSLGTMAFVVRVPLVTASGIATFHALWDEPLTDDEAGAAAELLQTLTRLTSIAERSLREGERLRLDSVLDGVADGVLVLHCDDGDAERRRAGAACDPRRRERRDGALQPAPAGRPAVRDPRRARSRTGDDLQRNGRPLPHPGDRARRPGARARRQHLPGAGRGGDRLSRRHRRARARGAERAVPLCALQLDPDPAHVVEASSQALISANQAFLELVGYDLDEIVGLAPPYPWWEPTSLRLPGFEPGAVVRQRLPAQGRPAAARRGRAPRRPRRRREAGAAARRGQRHVREAPPRPAARAEREAGRDRRAGRRRRARDQQPAVRHPRPDRVPAEGGGARLQGRTAARADPADRPRDQGDRARAARLRARKCRRTSRGCARRRGPLDGRPDPPHERPQGGRAGRHLRRRRCARQREPEPAQADLPQPDRERAAGDAERRQRAASRSTGTASTCSPS